MNRPESDPPVWVVRDVDGVSVWAYAPQLNASEWMDGRLLVPSAAGAAAGGPWDLKGLIPYRDARKRLPAEVRAAIADFRACLDRVAGAMGAEGAPFFKLAGAFSLPICHGVGADCYFYDPASFKLKVLNWGALPEEGMEGMPEWAVYPNFAVIFARERALSIVDDGSMGLSSPEPPGTARPPAWPSDISSIVRPYGGTSTENSAQRRRWFVGLLALLAVAGLLAFFRSTR